MSGATEKGLAIIKALTKRGVDLVSDPEHMLADPEEGGGRGAGWYAQIKGKDGTVHWSRLGKDVNEAVATAESGSKSSGFVGTLTKGARASVLSRVAHTGGAIALGAGIKTTAKALRQQGHTGKALMLEIGAGGYGAYKAITGDGFAKDAGLAVATAIISEPVSDFASPFVAMLIPEKKRKEQQQSTHSTLPDRKEERDTTEADLEALDALEPESAKLKVVR